MKLSCGEHRHERDQPFLVPVPSETNFGAGPSQKYFGHGPGPKKNNLVLVLFRKNFGAGPSLKNFWSGLGPGPGKKRFWSRDLDRDHFAHL